MPPNVVVPLPPPYDRWPVHRYRPGLDAVWFVPPRTLVTYVIAPWGHPGQVAYLNDRLDEVVAHIAPQRLLALHERRHLRGADAGCVAAWNRRASQRPDDYLEAAHLVLGPTPLLRMAVRTASLFFTRNDKSRPFGLHESFDAAVRALGGPELVPAARWVEPG